MYAIGNSRRLTWPALPVVLLSVILCAVPKPIQGETVPALGRPKKDFYGAESIPGRQVQVQFQAEPTNLILGEALTLTLNINQVAHPEKVQAPDLQRLPAFRKAFRIERMRDLDTTQAHQRRFAYRLWPRDATIVAIPVLNFVYHDPTRRPQFPDQPSRWFPSTSTGTPIPLRITEQTRGVSADPLSVPEFAEQLAVVDPQLGPRSLDTRWSSGTWFVFCFAPPVLVLVWILWGQRLPAHRRPGPGRLARRAIRALRGVPQEPFDTALTYCAGIVHSYLQARLGVSHRLQTPGEIEQFLQRQKQLDPEQICGIVRFFHRIDAARFGTDTPLGSKHFREAGCQLIEQLEEAAR